MKVKMILPSLMESGTAMYRPIKYSLFPPLGLASLAAHLPYDWEVELIDQHVMELELNDQPDLVMIEVCITNARRAYAIADHYRSLGCFVVLGGLHVTSLPQEASQHADVIFTGPADHSFPQFLKEWVRRSHQRHYFGNERSLKGVPLPRRDLIQRDKYLVPNSLVVSRGCPHHCTFCYKDNFYQGGRSFYTQEVDRALEDIHGLPGRHLYFLDDHLLGHQGFARSLFSGLKGGGRLFQGASTIDAIVDGDLIECAVEAGLRSVFIGFESISTRSLEMAGKRQNLRSNANRAIKRLHDLGVRINGSFVFGLDGDDADVFDRTVEWAVHHGLTTATFHIATPYPGTRFHAEMKRQDRILHEDWELYDTRHVVFQPLNMSSEQLLAGYHRAYKEFYRLSNIWTASLGREYSIDSLRQFAYSIGWKKFEPLWRLLIQTGQLQKSRKWLEGVLDGTRPKEVHGETLFCETKTRETFTERTA